MAEQSAQTWIKIMHPITKRFVGNYCPQTNELEVTDRSKRAVVKLPVK